MHKEPSEIYMINAPNWASLLYKSRLLLLSAKSILVFNNIILHTFKRIRVSLFNIVYVMNSLHFTAFKYQAFDDLQFPIYVTIKSTIS